MVRRFVDRWSKPKEDSITSKIANVGKPSENIKDQIAQVTQRLDMQTKTLDSAVLRFQSRDAEIFNRVVKAMAMHDGARANILATELAEIRKVEKMLTNASLALQSVSMRLRTVSELGDLVTVLAPAKSMLNNIRGEMCGIMPEASQELGNIGNLLTDIVGSTNQSNDISVNTITANADALQILEEAEVAAESRLRDQLPDVSAEKEIRRRSSLGA
ncbi:MAG: Snf7 family protein [Candidatus Bathyarchaeota archaeon]|nr:Snf7 family protein [Candidatus Bathyarchaeota archaeon]